MKYDGKARPVVRTAGTFAVALVALLVLAGCRSGPGQLVDFVSLGTGVRRHAVELTGENGPALAAELARLDVTNMDQARAALSTSPGPEERAFAFVLPGCAETGAELVIADGEIDAELTGGEDTACATAVYFLATFRVPADDVGDATLGH